MQLQPTTPVTIYALRDPDTGEPAYVGQTAQRLSRRLLAHLPKVQASRSLRGRWIQSLQAQGKRPVIVALEVTNHAHADAREYFHIARLQSEGYQLTNTSGACEVRAHHARSSREDVMESADEVTHDTSTPGQPDLLNGDSERVSVAEAAELLGVHTNTVRHRLKRGFYPFDKVLTPYGSAYMISRAAIEADLARATTGSNGAVAPIDSNGAHASISLTVALEAALAPLVEEVARARAEAAAAHERAGRLQAERDAAVLERNMERTRRYEMEQRRPWWRRLWGAS